MSAVGEGDSLVHIVLILWTSFCLLLGAMVGWTCHACRPWSVATFMHRRVHGCSPARPAGKGMSPPCSKGAGKGSLPTQDEDDSDSPRVSDIDSPRTAFNMYCKYEQMDQAIAATIWRQHAEIKKRNKKGRQSPPCSPSRCSKTPPCSPPPKGRQVLYHTDARGTMLHTTPQCRQLKNAKCRLIHRPVCSVCAPCGVAAG